MNDIELLKAYTAERACGDIHGRGSFSVRYETELLEEIISRGLGNKTIWCVLNKEATGTITYLQSDIETERVYSKGTYVQVELRDPKICLDEDGDGFINFKKEDLEEVLVDIDDPPSDWNGETALFQG